MAVHALEPGQLLTDEVFLVTEAKLAVDRRGQNYYSLTLNDESGVGIEGKIWSDNIGAEVVRGHGIEVLARVDEYRGQKQLNIQRYTVLHPDEYDLSAYVRTTDVDVDRAFETMFNWEGDEFTNPYFRRLMAEFHGKQGFAARFKTQPAASFHHHNYQGGLAEHTLEVWNIADRLCDLYSDRLDRDLLLAGAALHDIGKVNCYSLTAGVSERTEVGELLDHLFVSASMVSNLWDSAVRPGVGEEGAAEADRCKTLLLHVILSHHGKQEWGSPVVPRTPEAVMLHYCDVLSAGMHKCFHALEQAPPDQLWTDNVYLMDQPRRLLARRPQEAGQDEDG